MLDKYYHTKDIYYTREKMLAYMHNKLPDFEKRAFEKLLEEDDFLRDAYEGLKLQTTKENQRVISKLEADIDIITGAKKPRIIALNVRTMAVAAMLIVFLSISFLIINQLNKTEQQKIAIIEDDPYSDPDEDGLSTNSTLNANEPGTHSDAEHPVKKTEETGGEAEQLMIVEVEDDRRDNDIAAGSSNTEARPSQDEFKTRSTMDDVDAKKEKELDNSVFEDASIPADITEYDLLEISESINVKNTAAKSDAQIYIVVEQMPEYPGGEEAMYTFLAKNIKYPETARNDRIEGTVYIKFIVSNKGKITQAEVVRGIGGGCDEEALRVVKKMPDWNPALQQGKPVDVYYTLPIKFKLE